MGKNLVRMQHADRRKLLLSHAVNIFALKGYNFTTRELAMQVYQLRYFTNILILKMELLKQY